MNVRARRAELGLDKSEVRHSVLLSLDLIVTGPLPHVFLGWQTYERNCADNQCIRLRMPYAVCRMQYDTVQRSRS